jgi:hypothetical protein
MQASSFKKVGGTVLDVLEVDNPIAALCGGAILPKLYLFKQFVIWLVERIWV